MSANLKRCSKALIMISQEKNKKKRERLLKQAANHDCFLWALKEISQNYLKGNIPMNIHVKSQMKKYEPLIQRLSLLHSKSRGKKKLALQSGGWLGAIIPIATALLSLIR